ncbi:MAG TPA: hypothetical protein VKZ75_08210 [Cyclobacteriaceae bacterium]|nr:hypothetical protein [Cyclobacteriaceae bacterium]
MKKSVTLNSTLLYVAAFLLTTIIHELAHALVGAMNNSSPVIHHNYVEHLATEHLTVGQQILIAMAGPVISLIQGLFVGYLYLRSSREKITDLFLLWTAVLGFNNFLGYLMTGPFFGNGDIGRVYNILDTAAWIQLGLAVAAAGILLFIAYKLTVPFLRFSYKEDWVKDGKSRKNFSFHVLILPWIIGSVIVTVFYLPIIAIVSIIYPIMSGMVFIFPWQNAVNPENVKLSGNNALGRLSPVALGLSIVLAVVFRFVLAPGISI